MFIPRRPEIQLLHTHLQRVITDGSGATILVSGEPGIGKSIILSVMILLN